MVSQLQSQASHPISQTKLIFRNVSTNYLVAGTELLIGVFMLPFNVAHLGKSAYGLWVLVASATVYFSMLDMGFGVAQVRFIAKYRAEGDNDALNETASTMFWVFSVIGLLAFMLAIAISLNLDKLFSLSVSQAKTGQIVFLFISAYVAIGFPASVFGGVVNAYQRTYLNGVVAMITAIVVAGVNVGLLLAGYGLVALITVTTTVRILSYLAYARNAYRVFPALRIRPRYFKYSRLRKITGFSFFILLIDLANKINYSTDTIVIGAFLGTSAVAIWAVAQRMIEIVQRITDQLNSVLFPVVVDSSTVQRFDRLQRILLQGTRLSLAMAVPLATVLGLTARPLVMAWVGPDFSGSVIVIYILSFVVAIRVGNATSAVILKGSGRHQLLAMANMGMAIGNLVLSTLLVRPYGLVGVAVGTLIPIVVTSMFVIFPAACRGVNVPITTVLRESVWPAVWPAVVISILIVLSRKWISDSWFLLVSQSFLATTMYAVLFLSFAINRNEREWYFLKLKEIFKRPSIPSPSPEPSIPS